MQNKLQINLFSSNYREYRFPFTVKAIEQLNKIDDKSKVRLCIHAESSVVNKWRDYLAVKPLSIETLIVQYPDSNYLNRVFYSQKTDCKYSCKLDDDVLISTHVWNYIVGNLEAINPKNPIIAPVLTNGMPSNYLFIRDFLTKDEIEVVHQIFLKTKIENHFHMDYSSIDKKVKSMKTWNDRKYWDFVATADIGEDNPHIAWPNFIARGMHPARLSYEYNMYIANKIMEKKDKFYAKHDYSFETYVTPYFTNNMFVSETTYWKDTLPLCGGGFDEGQLSIRLMMDNTSILYVKNGFGIHMAYGHTHGASQIEKFYTENI